MSSVSAGQDDPQAPTAADLERAAGYLADARERVAREVAGLTPAQWQFQPAPERWSIAHVLEHLAAVEQRCVDLVVPALREAPAPPSDHPGPELDARLRAEAPSRTRRIEAPARLRPTGHIAPEEALRRFVAARAQLLAFARNPEINLRRHGLPHPAFGLLDGYQWLLALAGHSLRHADQIAELKAEANFPG